MKHFHNSKLAYYTICLTVGVFQSTRIAIAAPETTRPTLLREELGVKDVQVLIDRIDRPNSAAALKFGYFGRRTEASESRRPGLDLLEESIKKEPVATRRWYILENVRAYAYFRVQDASPLVGLASYSDVFEHAEDSPRTESQYFVLQSVNDFLFDIQGRFRDIGLRKDPKTIETMVKAWHAYTIALTNRGKRKFNFGPFPWGDAIDATSSESIMLPLLQSALDNVELKEKYDVVFAAAVANRKVRPDVAISLLERTLPTIPADSDQANTQYCKLLVQLYEATGNLKMAVLTQKQQVVRTRRGNAELLRLYLKAGLDDDAKQLIQSLCTELQDEREIVSTAERLREWVYTSDAHTGMWNSQLVQMLNTYLHIDRVRQVSKEIRARVILCEALLSTGNVDEARQAVEVEFDPTRLTGEYGALRDLNRFEDLKRSLEK